MDGSIELLNYSTSRRTCQHTQRELLKPAVFEYGNVLDCIQGQALQEWGKHGDDIVQDFQSQAFDSS